MGGGGGGGGGFRATRKQLSYAPGNATDFAAISQGFQPLSSSERDPADYTNFVMILVAEISPSSPLNLAE